MVAETAVHICVVYIDGSGATSFNLLGHLAAAPGHG